MAEVNYVAGLAMRWARRDAVEQWVRSAPAGARPSIEETVREYLRVHNPFPDGVSVEVDCGDRGWERGMVLERTDLDEWVVEYTSNGEERWVDHSEMRAR